MRAWQEAIFFDALDKNDLAFFMVLEQMLPEWMKRSFRVLGMKLHPFLEVVALAFTLGTL